jgi:hypothetical protein
MLSYDVDVRPGDGIRDTHPRTMMAIQKLIGW